MIETILPYPLPAQVRAKLLAQAAHSDLLILGELHGIQEVPRLILGLLPELEPLGYRGLAMEIPCDLRTPILDWIQGRTTDPTYFFRPRTVGDGRESVQAVSLFRQMSARQTGWNLLCFDQGGHQPTAVWEERDARMAGNLAEQWLQLCPGHKVLAVCGNYHSRLAPGAIAPPELWPSFAAQFVQAEPGRRVASIKLHFHSGSFHNGGVRSIWENLEEPASSFAGVEIRPSVDGSHTLELHLPFATPVTFLQEEILERTDKA